MDYPKLLAVKSLAYSPALAKEYYADLAARPFYGGLVKYMTSGTPVVAMVWEGKDIIRQSCWIVGATNHLEADMSSCPRPVCCVVRTDLTLLPRRLVRVQRIETLQL
nr:hypothetical protein L203_02084 [Cryptococcus depauperatus CBS 7841]